MNPRAHLNPPGWPKPPGYTHAVVTGGGRLVVLSGQVPFDASGSLVGGDFEEQARQVFENLGAVLRTAGATFGDVVKLTYFVVGLTPERVLTLRSVRDGYLQADRLPASSLIGVTALFQPEVLVEIEALAELPG